MTVFAGGQQLGDTSATVQARSCRCLEVMEITALTVYNNSPSTGGAVLHLLPLLEWIQWPMSVANCSLTV